MQQINVIRNSTLDFAIAELKRYLDLITEGNFNIDYKGKFSKENFSYEKISLENKGIWLGEIKDFNIYPTYTLEDRQIDDSIYINVINGNGIIAGANKRSILLAVYRFLREVGVRWIRPGQDGEILVKKDISSISVLVDEKAAFRHRGIVIEGACSYQNVVDMVDWAPKVGYNSYFIQFKEAYSFFQKWYDHVNNPYLENKKGPAFSVDTAKVLKKGVEEEIQKRGLIYHAVGHGWTCESIGIPSLGWDVESHTLQDKERGYLAQIKGKRDFWYGIPTNTNLCYSNLEVREIMVNHIIQYIEENNSIDMLHVWLADDFNNHCECEECQKYQPTDLYIKILNLLDSRLSIKGLSTKIVFLLYFELLFAPQTEKINNPERYIMMFAPISRTFEKSFASFTEDSKVPEYNRNKIVLPTNLEDNIAYLREWQNVFEGDSFDFDYPLGRAHYGDPGYYKISRIISEDIKNLTRLNLNGYLSCQEQRAFFPTGLPNYVMGMTLWNVDISFEELAEDYFKNAFGDEWRLSKEYLEKLSNLFDIEYWCAQKEWIDKDVEERLLKVPSVLSEYEGVIERNQSLDNLVHQTSWKYLTFHKEFTERFASILLAKTRGDKDLANKEFTSLVNYLGKAEEDIQRVFDVFRFIQISKWKLQLTYLEG